ncbi:monodechloroaminopyrrolnitrin synthase PrnB family protein [Cesiribacter sp. SM1]|uniref:monodechloroaminopyrrolnitrin synthase PrnB family protein n=1 Tax=Cesiribacter sp. SM1 TaxID=2861196 RepID=UPI001CD5C39C|nr:monodechloroaminopyrrolnitrin synthase PrnB family protein [Cesiribacter sp. SM1]
MMLQSLNSSSISIDQRQQKEDEYICSLDPLNADAVVKQIPAFNMDKNVEKLTSACYSLLPHPDRLESFDYYESVAAMRDLGFFLGSMKRHGVEPVEAVPELDYVLDVLGSKTNLPPRDTLLHYTSWNPVGFRRRTYTGTPDEDNLIQSVSMAMTPLIKAIFALEAMHSIRPDMPAFAACAKEAAGAFEGMIAGIVHTRKHVSVSYFAHELRLYFDPIHLHGKVYLGPGAVEMPMFVYDHLLWSSSNNDPAYVSFKETYLPYILPYLRDTYTAHCYKPSLLDIFGKFMLESELQQEEVWQAIREFRNLLNFLKSFRMPHKKIADNAYKAANGGEQQRTHGSGGYTPDILEVVLHHMKNAVADFENAVKYYESLPVR